MNISDAMDKAKKLAKDGTNNLKDAVSKNAGKIDDAISKTSEKVKEFTPDGVDTKVEEAASKAKSVLNKTIAEDEE